VGSDFAVNEDMTVVVDMGIDMTMIDMTQPPPPDLSGDMANLKPVGSTCATGAECLSGLCDQPGTGKCLATFWVTVTNTASAFGSLNGDAFPVINCGAGGNVCAQRYRSGTQVTVSASPVGGHTFSGWSGACSGGGSCVVTLSADVAMTGGFN